MVKRDMLTISILVPSNTFASAIYGTVEIFRAANLIKKMAGGQSLFHCQIVGTDLTAVNSFTDHDISVDTSIDKAERPDIWIVPGFYDALMGDDQIRQVMAKMQPAIQRLAEDHEQGSIVCGCCIGSFLLAEAGLLEGKPVQVYWRTEHSFQRMYPDLERRPDVTVLDSGDVITAAGAAAYGYLALHLIHRFGGDHLATQTAKYMLLDISRVAQPSYRDLFPWMDHGDNQIRQSQLVMLERYHEELTVQQLAEQCNISSRQYLRRFKQATGLTPLQQLQRVRLMEACKKLEFSNSPTQNIVWEVGYDDASSFRKLFKKEMGLTMEQYRQRFGVPVHSTTAA